MGSMKFCFLVLLQQPLNIPSSAMTGPEREFLMTVQPEMFCMISILIAAVPKEQNIELYNAQQGTKGSL